MSAVVAALGAVIGYLGAEVAEENIFDRILWPQRFQNYLDRVAFVKLAVFMPMSGPLHRAALSTLDRFRDHGLYKGLQRGDMLGTAFFAKHEGIKYFHRTADQASERAKGREVRNGFWVEVLRHVNHNIDLRRRSGGVQRIGPDEESKNGALRLSCRRGLVRAAKPVFHLKLDFYGKPCRAIKSEVKVSEAHRTPWVIAGIFASELSTLAVAIAAWLWYRFGDDEVPAPWLPAFLCIPLLLKLSAATFSVRCEGLFYRPARSPREEEEGIEAKPSAIQVAPNRSGTTVDQSPVDQLSGSPGGPQAANSGPESPADSAQYREILELDCPSLGFVLISTESSVSPSAFQFFRHYGHPIRCSWRDRIREVVSIVVVYAFVLYFPTGLVMLFWMNGPSQSLWLGQQLYCIVVMHIVRLCGWQDCARTEERVAAILSEKKVVCLVDDECCVHATLEVEDALSVEQGRATVRAILWSEADKGNSVRRSRLGAHGRACRESRENTVERSFPSEL